MCRFLRARKWDLEAALTMFEAAETWRKEFGVEELYKTFEYPEKEEVNKYYPQYYHKTDKVSSGALVAESVLSRKYAGRLRCRSWQSWSERNGSGRSVTHVAGRRLRWGTRAQHD